MQSCPSFPIMTLKVTWVIWYGQSCQMQNWSPARSRVPCYADQWLEANHSELTIRLFQWNDEALFVCSAMPTVDLPIDESPSLSSCTDAQSASAATAGCEAHPSTRYSLIWWWWFCSPVEHACREVPKELQQSCLSIWRGQKVWWAVQMPEYHCWNIWVGVTQLPILQCPHDSR